MATRKDLSVDDDDAQSSGESTKDGETPPVNEPIASDGPSTTKRLRKGWKDPKDPLAKGKFKMASGNICEHM